MNKIFYYAAAVIFFINSCTNEDYPKYDTSIKDGAYIEHFIKTYEDTGVESREEIDSVFYNFGFTDITEYTYEVRCAIMGVPRDYDREIKVTTNNSKYADNEFLAAKEDYYELPSTVILPKGEVETVIPVTLKRHLELETGRAILTLVLVANDNFDVKGNPEFTITFDDQLPETPGWWSSYNMGEFTKFKGQLFFKYFWEMEQENKYLFDKIVKRWGRNLDIKPYTGQNSPLVVYEFAFASLVHMKMWEYSEAHPELELNISKPTLN